MNKHQPISLAVNGTTYQEAYDVAKNVSALNCLLDFDPQLVTMN